MQEFLTNYPWIILLAALWILPWKGVALWKAASLKSKIWFVILFLVNTLGILEILYIFIFSRMSRKENKNTEENYFPGNSNRASKIKMGL